MLRLISIAIIFINIISYSHPINYKELVDTNVVDPISQIKDQFDSYIRVLHSWNVSEMSTFRKYYISIESKEEESKYYPDKQFMELKIPAHFLLLYSIRFEDYKLVDVNIIDLRAYDSGFTMIYRYYNDKKLIDFYNLDINVKYYKEKLLKELEKNEIHIKHQYDKKYKEITLQLYYVQEYEY